MLEDAVIPKKYKKSTGVIWLLRVVLVFVFCSFAWIFFASKSISDAFWIISHVFSGIENLGTYFGTGISVLGISIIDLLFLCISIFILMLYDFKSLRKDVIAAISSNKTFVRWSIYCFFVLWIMINCPVSNSTEFIYFQF